MDLLALLLFHDHTKDVPPVLPHSYNRRAERERMEWMERAEEQEKLERTLDSTSRASNKKKSLEAAEGVRRRKAEARDRRNLADKAEPKSKGGRPRSLSVQTVRNIKSMIEDGLSDHIVARKIGVSSGVIWQIRVGRSYRDI